MPPLRKCLEPCAFATQSVHLEDHTSIAETDFGKCKLLTHSRLLQFLNYMDEADTEKLEDIGWNHRRTRAGLVCAASLQDMISIESCHFDSMHIYFSNGLICQEIGYWWTRLQEISNVRIWSLAKPREDRLDNQHAMRRCCSKSTPQLLQQQAVEKGPRLTWQCGSMHGSSSTCLSLPRRSTS